MTQDNLEELAKLRTENKVLRGALKAALRKQRKIDACMLAMTSIIREVAGLEP